MAIVTRTYQWQGLDMTPFAKEELGASATCTVHATIFADVKYDDAIASSDAADAMMARSGWVPYQKGTAGITASLALSSPNKTSFDLQVNDQGALSTKALP